MTKITRLEASNFKRLKAVEITPEGNVVTISGENGNGKTSCLDAIAAALGGEKLCPKVPIREGQTEAHVTVELDSGLKVTRHWSMGKESTITVESADGARYRSPQAVLDALTTSLTFDPLAFMKMEPKKRKALLQKLIGLDPTEHFKKRKEIFDERTLINRSVEMLKASVPAEVKDAPEKEESIQDLLAEQEKARATKEANDKKRAELQKCRDDHAALSKQLADLLARGKKLSKECEGLKDPDVAGITARAQTLEARNKLFRQKAEREKHLAALAAKEKESKDLTAKLEAMDAEQAKKIAEAKMPVDGLGFVEEDITFKGLPFDQAGNAERLRVSTAVGLALNPKLKVLQIEDASLIGKGEMAIIAEMAKAADAQIWIEKVVDDASQAVGIVISDGMVLGAPPPKKEEKAKRAKKEKASPAADGGEASPPSPPATPAAGASPADPFTPADEEVAMGESAEDGGEGEDKAPF